MIAQPAMNAAVIIIDLIWLLPLAMASALRPEHGMAITAVALLPLAGASVLSGAGRGNVIRSPSASGATAHGE